MQEFFGKPFRYTLLGFVGLFLLSLIGYFTNTSLIILALLGLATMAVTFRKLEFGLAIAFLELLSNAHGQIVFAPIGSFTVSARMVIFVSVFFGFLFHLLTKKVTLSFRDARFLFCFPLFIAFCIGMIVGISKRSFAEVFLDGNAYLYALYLFPILSISWTSLKQRIVLQMLAAGAVFTSILSLLLLYAYTHLSQPFLDTLYVYLRDIRFAEITSAEYGMERIFAQTQFFSILFGLLLLLRFFMEQTKKDRLLTHLSLSLIFSTLLVSLSRSFWFGFLAACLALFVFTFSFFKNIRNLFIAGLSSVVLLFMVLFFPFPTPHVFLSDASNAFRARVSESDAGVSSRWNLLSPMLNEIKNAPVFGSGFGQTVTFTTDDPRIRAVHADGTRTTVSMEWGWLETWLKMGIFGPLGFLFLFVMMVRAASEIFQSEKRWVGVWIVSTLTFLYFTHMFSPYLNHPIGLGTILLLMIFLPMSNNPFSFAFMKFAKQKMPRAELAASVVTSKQR